MGEGDGSVGKDRVFHDVIDVTDGEGGGDEVVKDLLPCLHLFSDSLTWTQIHSRLCSITNTVMALDYRVSWLL